MVDKNIEPHLAPVARIDFRKRNEVKGSYIFYKKDGRMPSTLLGVYKRGCLRGEKYITLQDACKHNAAMSSRYNYFLYTNNEGALQKKREAKPEKETYLALITGFNLTPEFPNRAYGDGCIYGDGGNDALLIEFRENMDELTIWLFEGQKMYAKALFEKWTSGELVLSVRDNVLPVKSLKGVEP